jgi:NAD(P)-dependent dehydrogenase (short-subunit alcohol dehydrogenase family)
MPHPRAALVTGGNRGIGLEVCRQLVVHGRRVLLACRDVDSGAPSVQRQRTGTHTHAHAQPAVSILLKLHPSVRLQLALPITTGRAAASTLLHEASAPTGADIVVLPLDAVDADSIQALAQKVAADYDQQVDLLVMNAGILVREEWSRQAYDRTLAVNTAGPCRLADALLPHLAPGALIVAVSSSA